MFLPQLHAPLVVYASTRRRAQSSIGVLLLVISCVDVFASKHVWHAAQLQVLHVLRQNGPDERTSVGTCRKDSSLFCDPCFLFVLEPTQIRVMSLFPWMNVRMFMSRFIMVCMVPHNINGQMSSVDESIHRAQQHDVCLVSLCMLSELLCNMKRWPCGAFETLCGMWFLFLCFRQTKSLCEMVHPQPWCCVFLSRTVYYGIHMGTIWKHVEG